MANRTITEVREALKAVAQTISLDDGFSCDVAPNHIYEIFDTNNVAPSEDVKYPKFFFLIESGSRGGLPSMRVLRKVTFLVIAIFKQTGGALDLTATAKVEGFIEDFEKVLMSNDTLNGVVQDAIMTEFTTDAGALDPEGCVAIKVEVEYFKQY